MLFVGTHMGYWKYVARAPMSILKRGREGALFTVTSSLYWKELDKTTSVREGIS